MKAVFNAIPRILYSSLESPNPSNSHQQPEVKPPPSYQTPAAAELDVKFAALKLRASRLYNSTSTVCADNTITNPNHDQVLFCIAMVVQAKIFDDSTSDSLIDIPTFEFHPLHLPAESGGPIDPEMLSPSLVEAETLDDPELKEKILDGSVPTVDTIFRFLNLLFVRAQFSAECNVVAWIYMNRLSQRNKITLTSRNWRGLWVGAVCVAQKMWDDNALPTSSFITILPPVSKKQLRDVEMKILCLMSYTFGVTPSEYAKFYFELRDLYANSVGNDGGWNMKPLTIVQAMRLEERCNRSISRNHTTTTNGNSINSNHSFRVANNNNNNSNHNTTNSSIHNKPPSPDTFKSTSTNSNSIHHHGNPNFNLPNNHINGNPNFNIPSNTNNPNFNFNRVVSNRSIQHHPLRPHSNNNDNDDDDDHILNNHINNNANCNATYNATINNANNNATRYLQPLSQSSYEPQESGIGVVGGLGSYPPYFPSYPEPSGAVYYSNPHVNSLDPSRLLAYHPSYPIQTIENRQIPYNIQPKPCWQSSNPIIPNNPNNLNHNNNFHNTRNIPPSTTSTPSLSFFSLLSPLFSTSRSSQYSNKSTIHSNPSSISSSSNNILKRSKVVPMPTTCTYEDVTVTSTSRYVLS